MSKRSPEAVMPPVPATLTFWEAVDEAEKLGLCETRRHGDNRYARLTQTGYNMFNILLIMQGQNQEAGPEDILKAS